MEYSAVLKRKVQLTGVVVGAVVTVLNGVEISEEGFLREQTMVHTFPIQDKTRKPWRSWPGRGLGNMRQSSVFDKGQSIQSRSQGLSTSGQARPDPARRGSEDSLVIQDLCARPRHVDTGLTAIPEHSGHWESAYTGWVGEIFLIHS